MSRPVWDESLQRQYEALTQQAAWVDVGPRTELLVGGRDALRVLNNNCTADLAKLGPGEGTEAFFLTTKGTTVGHGAVFLGNNRIDVSTVAGQASALVEHLQRFIVSEQVEFDDRSDHVSSILVAGKRAAKALAAIGCDRLPEARLAHLALMIDAIPADVRRTDLLGIDGYEFVVPATSREELIARLGEHSISESSRSALEALRIELGIPLFGVDIDARSLPQEIGRDAQAISFTKGCYLGQETVARIDSLGHVNRHLVLLAFRGNEIPPVGFVVEHHGKPIARVTSSGWSPRTNSPLAMAMARDGFHRVGQVHSTPLGDATVVRLDA
jgi:folate-binding protein YgfZ